MRADAQGESKSMGAVRTEAESDAHPRRTSLVSERTLDGTAALRNDRWAGAALASLCKLTRIPESDT
jgi:hypothetical protein